MVKFSIDKPTPFFADAIFLFLLCTLIYGLTHFGQQWKSSYNPNYEIDLSFFALPLYALFSALRGLIAYGISLFFTIAVGYWAAKSPKAERIILPFLDIMQSIPVLGFLPGLVLGLVALFPKTNVGLEMSAIIMIFTGQVWNMTFAFYSSLKSVPTDLKEASSVMGLSSFEKLKLLELPFSAMSLTWNSVMSMAGGWFFLTVCEAFTLGGREYRLPGLGAYMAVAIEKGETPPIIGGIVAMAIIIILFDALLWRPALAWAHGFRLEEDNRNQRIEEPLIQLLIKESFVMKIFRSIKFHSVYNKKTNPRSFSSIGKILDFRILKLTEKSYRILLRLFYLGALVAVIYGTVRLTDSLGALNLQAWVEILRDTGFTLLRVLAATVISTLWALPFGIWVTQSASRLRIVQPIVQMMASFPAPMLYPLVISVFLFLNINFEISAMLLMLLGVQWYILFNVIAGALRVPQELKLSMQLMQANRRSMWRYLYIPSVFPSLVTGWITAAGGAWNASIVSELITYKGQILEAHGLGAEISHAAASGEFPRLAACLLVMVLVVVVLNRTVWAKIYYLAQTRFRLDL